MEKSSFTHRRDFKYAIIEIIMMDWVERCSNYRADLRINLKLGFEEMVSFYFISLIHNSDC